MNINNTPTKQTASPAWLEELAAEQVVAKAEINWPYTLDFKVQATYIVQFIRAAQKILRGSDREKKLATAMQASNLLAWVNQMKVMGFLSLEGAVADLLEENFADGQALHKTYIGLLNSWLEEASGQCRLGDNYVTALDGALYYRDLEGEWYAIAPEEAFTVPVVRGEKVAESMAAELDQSYEKTPYQRVYDAWRSIEEADGLAQKASSTLLAGSITQPDTVLEQSLHTMQLLLKEPVTIDEITNTRAEGVRYIERMIQITTIMTQYVQRLRKKDNHTFYLLRDCLMFNEIHHLLDMLTNTKTSHDQVYVGRKLLSSATREGGFWQVTAHALHMAYLKCGRNFDAFYAEYTRHIQEYEAYDAEFAKKITEVALYIDAHLPKETPTTIEVVDLGFQGSINMLIKYIIEHHLAPQKNNRVEVNMMVAADWFASVYGDARHFGRHFSLLTNIEDLTRNEYLYDYEPDSFSGGQLAVHLNSNDATIADASRELAAVTMIVRSLNEIGEL